MSDRRRYPYVQALRAVAALSVGFFHIGHDLLSGRHLPALAWALRAMPWRAGVDIFFVISGFVVVHASRPLFGTAAGPARFLARRLIRIVPLYWTLTTLLLAVAWLSPRALHGADAGPLGILASYLFVPCARTDGVVEPVLGLGWTLEFEMLFYAVLAACLRLARARAVAAACLVLLGFLAAVRLGILSGVAAHTWGNPLVLEFCAGMGLALAAERLTLPVWCCGLLTLAALLSLHETGDRDPHALFFGVPAAMLVAAATCGRSAGARPRAERGLERLGDASYAFYLVHPFVMRPASIVWSHLGRAPAGAGLPASFVVLAAAEWAALALHRWFERPVTRALRRLLPGEKVSVG